MKSHEVTEYSPLQSPEVLSRHIDWLYGMAGASEVPYIENEEVQVMENDLSERVIEAGFAVNTGINAKSEQKYFMEVSGLYFHLLGAIAYDRMLREYRQTGDARKAEQAMKGYLKTAKSDVAFERVDMQLELSPIERSRQWLAHKPVIKYGLPIAVGLSAGAVANQVLKNGDPGSMDVSWIPEFGKQGIAAAVGYVATGKLVARHLPKGASAVVRRFDLERYKLPKAIRNNPELTREDIMRIYADKYVKAMFQDAGSATEAIPIESEADLKPVLDVYIRTALKTTYELHNIPQGDPKGLIERLEEMLEA